MRKKQLIQNLWVPIETRLPPNNDSIILAWNSYQRRAWHVISRIARKDAQEIIRNPNIKKESPNASFYMTHWTKFYGPEGEELGNMTQRWP